MCPWCMREWRHGRHAAANKREMGNDDNTPVTVLSWLFGWAVKASGRPYNFLHISARQVQASSRPPCRDFAPVLGAAIHMFCCDLSHCEALLQSLALIQSPSRKTAVSSANNIPLGCFKMYVDMLSFVKTCNTLVSSSTVEKNEFYLANLKYDPESSPRLTGIFSCSVALHSESLSLTILVLVVGFDCFCE
jgi:hypothetical protein